MGVKTYQQMPSSTSVLVVFMKPTRSITRLPSGTFRNHRFEQLVVVADHDHVRVINHATQVAVHQVREVRNLLVDVFAVGAVGAA